MCQPSAEEGTVKLSLLGGNGGTKVGTIGAYGAESDLYKHSRGPELDLRGEISFR